MPVTVDIDMPAADVAPWEYVRLAPHPGLCECPLGRFRADVCRLAARVTSWSDVAIALGVAAYRTLPPRQGLNVHFTASRGVITFELTYLSGYVESWPVLEYRPLFARDHLTGGDEISTAEGAENAERRGGDERCPGSST